MKKLTTILLFLAIAAGNDVQAQRKRSTRHPRAGRAATVADVRKEQARTLAPSPGQATVPIAIPAEKGRTVMQEQISNSGSVIATPVPKPRKVVVVPAPPPPGNTMTTTPRRR